MVDSEYNMGIYKSVNVSIRTVMKNLKMLKFFHDHLKTKKFCKNAVKKLHFVIRYVSDSTNVSQSYFRKRGNIRVCS